MTALCVSRVSGLKSNTILITCIQTLSQTGMYFVSSLRFKENDTHWNFLFICSSMMFVQCCLPGFMGDTPKTLHLEMFCSSQQKTYIWLIFLFLFSLIKNFKMCCDDSCCTFLSQMLHLAALLSQDASMFH